jgi:hypothetical protein
MPAAATMTNAATPLEVLLGIGMLLLWTAHMVRAFTARGRRRASAPTPTARTRAHSGLRREPTATPAAARTRPPGTSGAERAERTPGRRLAESPVPLARVIDRSRRLNVAEDRVATDLAALPGESWLVERGVLVDGGRIPFLVIGPSGLFVLCASDGA